MKPALGSHGSHLDAFLAASMDAVCAVADAPPSQLHLIAANVLVPEGGRRDPPWVEALLTPAGLAGYLALGPRHLVPAGLETLDLAGYGAMLVRDELLSSINLYFSGASNRMAATRRRQVCKEIKFFAGSWLHELHHALGPTRIADFLREIDEFGVMTGPDLARTLALVEGGTQEVTERELDSFAVRLGLTRIDPWFADIPAEEAMETNYPAEKHFFKHLAASVITIQHIANPERRDEPIEELQRSITAAKRACVRDSYATKTLFQLVGGAAHRARATKFLPAIHGAIGRGLDDVVRAADTFLVVLTSTAESDTAVVAAAGEARRLGVLAAQSVTGEMLEVIDAARPPHDAIKGLTLTRLRQLARLAGEPTVGLG